MGDMGDYWRDVKESSRKYKEKNGWISQQYKSEKERYKGTQSKNSSNFKVDMSELERLKRLGVEPEYKSTCSFMVTVNGRQAMYYTGVKGYKLHFKDGEKVNLGYKDLDGYLEELNKEVV